MYAQGLIVIALDGGRVQALAADSLKTRWLTDEVSDCAQSSSTLTVRDGYVYVGTVDVVSDENRNTTYNNGTFTRIDLLTGAISWRYAEFCRRILLGRGGVQRRLCRDSDERGNGRGRRRENRGARVEPVRWAWW